jgi:hypothetical protein
MGIAGPLFYLEAVILSHFPAAAFTMTLNANLGSNKFTFGKHYAVLNLDLMTVLIDMVKDTSAGRQFLSNCSLWNDAVHEKETRPLSIFTSLFFTPSEPELARGAPFTKLVHDHGEFPADSVAVEISSTFLVDHEDIVLQKTRFYAGAGNGLEIILRANNIDTVVIVRYKPKLHARSYS